MTGRNCQRIARDYVARDLDEMKLRERPCAKLGSALPRRRLGASSCNREHDRTLQRYDIASRCRSCADERTTHETMIHAVAARRSPPRLAWPRARRRRRNSRWAPWVARWSAAVVAHHRRWNRATVAIVPATSPARSLGSHIGKRMDEGRPQ
jgi:hypothetical protein